MAAEQVDKHAAHRKRFQNSSLRCFAYPPGCNAVAATTRLSSHLASTAAVKSFVIASASRHSRRLIARGFGESLAALPHAVAWPMPRFALPPLLSAVSLRYSIGRRSRAPRQCSYDSSGDAYFIVADVEACRRVGLDATRILLSPLGGI